MERNTDRLLRYNCQGAQTIELGEIAKATSQWFGGMLNALEDIRLLSGWHLLFALQKLAFANR